MILRYSLWPLLTLVAACAAWGEEEGGAPPDMLASSVRVIGFLLVFMVLALLASRLAKRINPAFGGGGIEIIGGRTLAPGVGVRLVRIGSRCLLVGFTKEQISLLTEVSPADLTANKGPLP